MGRTELSDAVPHGHRGGSTTTTTSDDPIRRTAEWGQRVPAPLGGSVGVAVAARSATADALRHKGYGDQPSTGDGAPS
ncbi:MAG TPA: hypothetical protein VHV82_14480 [Sporichthyaceae bacterium]|nr:hypothetical protein [Sporichthyaceae bacterium]